MGSVKLRNGNVFKVEGAGDESAGGASATGDGTQLRNGNVFRLRPEAVNPPAVVTDPVPPLGQGLAGMAEDDVKVIAPPPAWELEVDPESYLRQFGLDAAQSEAALAHLGLTREDAEILLSGGETE